MPKTRFKKFLKIFYQAGYQTVHDDGIEHAGYLAFLGMLSIFPSLIFFFALAAGLGRADFGGEFISEIYRVLPKNIGEALSPRIDEILNGPPQGLITIAIIGIVWSASSAVEGLRTILNRIYHVKNPPRYIFRRLRSILQFIVFIFIITVAMFFLTIAPAITEYAETTLKMNLHLTTGGEIVRYIISSIVLLIVISASYYILPNIEQSFVRAMPGAFIVVILWLSLVKLFAIYVTYYPQISVVYGSLAGIILTLIFFYVLSIIYIYGAEFNYFLEKYLGHEIEEKEQVKATK